MAFAFLIGILFTVALQCCSGVTLNVTVEQGMLAGEEVESYLGGTFYKFLGIPYAEPPVGDLRFKAPQAKQSWEGVRNATEFRPVCIQNAILNPNLTFMSEDCLYLNVYTPTNQSDSLLPVMVWIHGGGFTWGSGDDDFYGPQFLIRNDIVIVTLNYRLEGLGFLALHSADIPGNAGMKDQVAALRWVKKNIKNFGGNPDKITLVGESAGAGSVSYHLISPMSKGLFQKVITASGTAQSWWAQDLESREKAIFLARKLGFYSENDTELYEFFKAQPAESFINLTLKIWKAQKPYELDFAITSEKDFGQERFFYGEVIDRLENDIPDDIEILTGYNKDEGVMALFAYSMDKMLEDAKYYTTFFTPKRIQTSCVMADQLEVGRKMREYYLKGGNVTQDIVIQFLNIDMFVFDIMLAAKYYAKKHKVYFYKFMCSSNRNFMGSNVLTNKTVVSHADDLAYIFPLKLKKSEIDQNSTEFQMVDNISTLWTNFIKSEHPTPGSSLNVTWLPFTAENQNYLEIGSELKTYTAPDKEELQFWEDIFKIYSPKYTYNS